MRRAEQTETRLSKWRKSVEAASLLGLGSSRSPCVRPLNPTDLSSFEETNRQQEDLQQKQEEMKRKFSEDVGQFEGCIASLLSHAHFSSGSFLPGCCSGTACASSRSVAG